MATSQEGLRFHLWGEEQEVILIFTQASYIWGTILTVQRKDDTGQRMVHQVLRTAFYPIIGRYMIYISNTAPSQQKNKYLFPGCQTLVVRVPGYRSRSPGSIPCATRFSEKQWIWNGVHSASWVQMRSYLTIFAGKLRSLGLYSSLVDSCYGVFGLVRMPNTSVIIPLFIDDLIYLVS
jgi:hypothetical protein